jgi:hypothetical protein
MTNVAACSNPTASEVDNGARGSYNCSVPQPCVERGLAMHQDSTLAAV